MSAEPRAALVAAALGCLLAACSGAPTPPADTALSTGPTRKVPLTSANAAPDGIAPSTRARTATKPPRTTPGKTRTPTPSRPRSVHAIGDSITLDAQPNLLARIPGITIDAEVGRQVGPGLDALQRQHDTGRLADVTVFALGTNGPFTVAQIDSAVALTAGRRLVIVTSHCPYCAWTATNNADVRRLCVAAAHCTVADFAADAQRHPEWFGPDGVHMAVGGQGADDYARRVAAALASPA